MSYPLISLSTEIFPLYVSPKTVRLSGRLLHGQKELELWGKFFLGIQSVGEVDSADAAVSMELDPQGFDVVGAVCTAGEIGQVKLDLVPAFIQTHGHGTDERLDSGRALVVGCSETTTNVLVIQDLDLESEVLLQVLDDHHEKGEFDPECLFRVHRARNEVRGDVRTHDLEYAGLDIGIG